MIRICLRPHTGIFALALQVGLCLTLVFASIVPVAADNMSLLAVERPLYDINISKSERRLYVMRFGRLVRSYHISSGSKEGDKLRRGDKRTPVGDYTVLEVRGSDRYHVFMHLDYPAIHDAADAYYAGRIDAREYQSFRDAHASGKIPPQHTLLGGQIGIHGLGQAATGLGSLHDRYNWTKGCIAVTDEVIEELKKHYIRPGTRVRISE